MAGYIRQSSFSDGDTITAALFNNEYNQLLNAFSNTTGHAHDGTTAEGPVIGLIGDAGETSPNNKVLIDTTNNFIEFYVEVSSAPVQQLYISDGAIIPVTDSDVDLGTTSLRFKDTYTDTVTTTGNVSVGGNLTVTGTTTFNGGTITMGDAATDNVVFGADIDSHIIPDDDDTYDLGSSSQQWRNLYVDGTANLDVVDIDGAVDFASTTAHAGNATFADSAKAIFGAGSDLQIYHDGSNSIVQEVGTGDLRLAGNVVRIRNSADTENMISAVQDGAVTICYDGNSKLATTSTGVDVTGNVESDTVTIGVSSVAGSEKLRVNGTVLTLGGSVSAPALGIGDTNTGIYAPTAGELGWTVNGTQRLFLDSTGVGIGTTSPFAKLHVGTRGSASALSYGSSGDGIVFDFYNLAGSPYTRYANIVSSSSDTSESRLGLWTQAASGTSSEKLTILGDGNVGINTSSPTSNLHIKTTVDNSLAQGLVIERSANTDKGYINYNGGGFQFRSTVGDPIVFGDTSNEQMRITSTGIDVTGTATMDGLTVNSGASDTVATFQSTDQFADLALTDSGGTSYIRQSNGSLILEADRANASASSAALIKVDGTQVARFASGGDISFYEDTGTTQALFWDASAESLGIGTTSPTTPLHVYHATTDTVANFQSGDNSVAVNFTALDNSIQIATSSTDSIIKNNGAGNFRLFNNGSERVRIDSSGNVGIGTNSPSDKLSISSGSNQIGLDTGDISTYGTLDVGHFTNGAFIGTQSGSNAASNSLRFGTSGTTRMTLNSSGNLVFPDDGKAIFGAGSDLQIYHNGTDSYIYDGGTGDLNIRGQSNVKLSNAVGANYFQGTNGAEARIYYNGSTKLQTTSSGIDVTGTAVTDGLTVAGEVSVDGGSIKLDGNYPVGASNVALGNTALDSITSDGSNNTAIGDAALTANTTGTSNVAVGSGALDANTVANANTAVGKSALGGNTTGSNNTAIGLSSLGVNVNGGSNVAVGNYALDANTSANFNTAVGYASLSSNTTGANIVAVGKGSLGSNTTADDNVAVGVNSLSLNTTGTFNVGIGRSALYSNTTASNNTAVGDRSLDANTTGSENTGVGKDALSSNTTGSENTGVGRYALRANTIANYNTSVGTNSLYANTTGGNNVAVGRSSLTGNTTASNNVAVGTNSLLANTTGASNTAVGTFSLDANTTANNNTGIGYASLGTNTEGAENTAVGMRALYSNTTASNNTAVGKDALYANITGAGNTVMGSVAGLAVTTGSNNALFGYGAGDAITTGTSNVAVGAFSLSSTTTAGSNTAVGTSALGATTSGANNVAVGTSALTSNTTGTDSVGVGKGALNDNTTGSYNTALGYLALSNNTTANFNTAIGRLSMLVNTTGASNTTLGAGALQVNTTGSNNVALGADALVANTTGTKNVCIGYGAGDAITTGSNNTIIGDYAGTTTLADTIVLASGTTERMRIDGSGNLGIGTTSPTTQVTASKSANISQVAITSSSNAVAWDATAAANAYHVTTENTTFAAPTNSVEGAIISVEIAQGGTARTVAWNTVFEFAASTAPTVTATANKTDIFSFRYNGSVWQEIGRVQNMAQT